MEESFLFLKTLFNESDSVNYISNFENDLNLFSENIFSLISNVENLKNLMNENKKKSFQKFIIIKPKNNSFKTSDNISTQTEDSIIKENKIRKIKKKYTKKEIKLFKCICGKVFHSKENQILHFKNIHLKQKPYKCSYCNSKFSHRNGKTYHERIFHTFILPYKCDYDNCKLSFASKSALTYHKNNKHYKS